MAKVYYQVHCLGIVTLCTLIYLHSTKLSHWNTAGCPALINSEVHLYTQRYVVGTADSVLIREVHFIQSVLFREVHLY